ncbi:MAG: thiamine diphosphokinase [Acholeplasma sp.]|nr:thiamine diphosphokinase [Acholeplasma sp.]
MKTIVVSPKVPENIQTLVDFAHAYVIAVDSAVKKMNELGIKYNLALGDFDSLDDLSLIQSETYRLNPIKDESDTAKAIEMAYQKSSEVYLVGGLKGNRIDHLYANLILLQKYPRLIIMDDTNHITLKTKGTYHFFKNEYDYLSLFALEDSIISIKGVKYPLTNYVLKKDNPIGLSNEIIKEAILEIDQGSLLIIQSKD